jgi:membrane associated rhomboid family serine protease
MSNVTANGSEGSTTITIGSLSSQTLTTPLSSPNSTNHTTGHESTFDSPASQWPMLRLVERNAEYLWSQLQQLIRARIQSSNTYFMPSICGTITLLYMLNVVLSGGTTNGSPFISALTLSPGHVLSPNYWLLSCVSMLTYPFVEFHWWQVLNDILVVSLCTTLIEPLWGRKELVSFFFVVNVFVAFFTIVHYIFLFSIYGDTKYLYDVRMYGLSGYCAAVCVTIKQMLPESVLVASSFGKLKNNHVPLCGLLMSYVFYVAGFVDGCLTLMFLYGVLISWFYLRFVQLHPSNGLRGDLSPSFDFVTFFPNVLRPPVTIIANSVHALFVRLNLLSPISQRQYQNLRVLSERLSHEHGATIVAKHFKHHRSGDYQHLHQQQQPLVQQA